MGKVAIHYGWIPLILYIGLFSRFPFKMVRLTVQDILKALLVLHTGSISNIFALLISEFSSLLVVELMYTEWENICIVDEAGRRGKNVTCSCGNFAGTNERIESLLS